MNTQLKTPRISVGLPVFNGEKYLSAAIESILNQDFRELELIIVDNASTDNSAAIARRFAREDDRVRFYQNSSNIGASENYNKAFQLSKGEYFKWAAHDDECYPEMLGECVRALDNAPDSVAMVYTLGELIDEEGDSLKSPLDRIECRDHRPHKRLSHLMKTLNMCDPIFGVYRSSYLSKTQLIGSFCGPDYVLLGELAMLGEIWELDQVRFRLRSHTKRSMTANRDIRSRTAWYNPKAASQRFLLPVWEQMVWALVTSIANAQMPVSTKIKCIAAGTAVHYWRRFRNFGGRVKAETKRALFNSRTVSS